MQIKLIIDRIEEGVAVLKKGEENINLPINCLPKDIKEGDVLNMEISKDGVETEVGGAKAKEILNEILKNDNNGM